LAKDILEQLITPAPTARKKVQGEAGEVPEYL
jgi:hypothetical protein